ncbi:biopolymer transporter ExbD [Iodidimonas sp. SYSU 1G8]|uniref:ExbD/TolR family protein n=1 Tax=Iodidimonas sp. SYSU 1G8 TaxID=3133967 RepID=UPI0031FE4D38
MAMAVGAQDDEVISTINTTPLVDVMLVLLIIFLITIPVVVQTLPVELPTATNQVTVTKPENVVVAVDAEGKIYWNAVQLANQGVLMDKLAEVAVMVPQPEVHIRGDKNARYDFIGRVVVACQRSGIVKLGFITEPVRAPS